MELFYIFATLEYLIKSIIFNMLTELQRENRPQTHLVEKGSSSILIAYQIIVDILL